MSAHAAQPVSDDWAAHLEAEARSAEPVDWERSRRERQAEMRRERSRATAGNGAAAHEQGVEWPEPGQIDDIPPAPDFPADALPSVLRAVTLDQAERMSCPADFLAIPGLVALAGSIGKRPTLRPKRCDDWSERACLWALILAGAGSMKSSALKPALAPLHAVEKERMAAWREEHAAWQARERERELRRQAEEKAAKKALDKDPSADIQMPQFGAEDVEPASPRMVVADTTAEKLVDLMAGSPGLTLVRDELSGWLLNMARYHSGSDRQFYLECWSGGSFTVDRIRRGSQTIDDLYLNVVGGIQPKVASSVLADPCDADGFFDRFGLLAFPGEVDYRHVDRWPDTTARRAYRETCERLAGTDWTQRLRSEGDHDPLHVRFAPDAQEMFDAWLAANMRELAALRQQEDPLAGFIGKGRGTLVRLALVIHLTRWATGEAEEASTVDRASFEAARKLFDCYLVPTYRRVLAAFGTSEARSDAKRIADHLQKRRPESVRPSDITKLGWQGLTERGQVEAALTALMDADWLGEPIAQSSPKGGRPAKAYPVNPKVHR